MFVELRKYRTAVGTVPLDEWLASLRHSRARIRILQRLKRLQFGLEGQWRSVGRGVRELKIDEGKGYRVYYAWHGTDTVVLLCGGDKSSQRADINRAITYWHDHEAKP